MSSDTLVVGAGVAGCSAALHLARSGSRVTVLDRGGTGAGASGRNGGFLFRQPLGWVNDLHAESLSIYEELAEEAAIPFGLRPWPMLVLAVDPEELVAARAYAEAVGGQEIDLREDPWFADDLAGGFVVEGGFTLDALGATTALAETARRAGVDFRLGCEAKRIIVARGRVSGLATDDGVLPCERVVLATGPRLGLLLGPLGVDLPIAVSRGWLLETGPVDALPRYAIEQALWPVQDEMAALVGAPTIGEVAEGAAEDPGIVSLLLGARPSGHLLIGTSLRRSLLEEPEGPDTIRRLAARAARVSPSLTDVQVAAAWSGRRAHTPDGLPIVGAIPGADGLLVAGGFSSIGMVTAPAACRRLVSDEAGLFDPARLAALS